MENTKFNNQMTTKCIHFFELIESNKINKQLLDLLNKDIDYNFTIHCVDKNVIIGNNINLMITGKPLSYINIYDCHNNLIDNIHLNIYGSYVYSKRICNIFSHILYFKTDVFHNNTQSIEVKLNLFSNKFIYLIYRLFNLI